ncbi:Protein kinase family protein (fragment) [Hyella patelloides LEGE 07179]|uniref:non-specific serine/threonine protein kinase n=1 Tax=Hyella patelloides LEGE 07179 TaxID=945734 RepID=A0A563W2S5_9CYAN
MALQHKFGEIIADRYKIINILGEGNSGITYRVEDLQTKQQIALKAFSFQQMTEWKMMELFEREAQILKQLNHPAIPSYLDYFQVDTETEKTFYIAQQLAEGESLATLVTNGWRGDETEVKRIAIELLKILVYLHLQKPSVIHRDLKPHNIILGNDGKIFLVDFGAVKHTYTNFLKSSYR